MKHTSNASTSRIQDAKKYLMLPHQPKVLANKNEKIRYWLISGPRPELQEAFLADADRVVVQESVIRDIEVRRSRTLANAPGAVVVRPVARAEVAAVRVETLVRVRNAA